MLLNAVAASHAQPAVPSDNPCGGPVTVSFPSQCHAPMTAAQERALKPKDTFRECENCPAMVVVPAGSVTVGSPTRQKDRAKHPGPQHTGAIGTPCAVGQHRLALLPCSAR